MFHDTGATTRFRTYIPDDRRNPQTRGFISHLLDRTALYHATFMYTGTPSITLTHA